MTRNQIINHRNLILDVPNEKKKHKYQLLENQEMRKFINDHELLVDRAFDLIMKELGNKSEEIKDGKKRKEVTPPSRKVDAKGMYQKWLLDFYKQSPDKED